MPLGDLNPQERFSDRVEDYVRYRPGYPASLRHFLERRGGLRAGAPVADIGSGTGIFARLLLEAGAKVWAVEPNAAMRHAAEAALGGAAGFTSVTGSAERTTLAAQSVALITCAQAFHWFDPEPTRREFRRILAPGGWCALVWNTAVPGAGDFSAGYEAIKSRFGTDFHRIRHENLEAEGRFDAFFGHAAWERHAFDNFQTLDWEGLKGRLLSSSYAPKAGDPRHAPMLAELEALFRRCEREGVIRLDYATELFLGQFAN